MISSHWMNY